MLITPCENGAVGGCVLETTLGFLNNLKALFCLCNRVLSVFKPFLQRS